VDDGESAYIWRVGFETDADKISIRLLSGVGYRFVVNGQYATLDPFSFAGGGLNYVTLDFGSVDSRLILVESYSAGGFIAVNVAPAYKVSAPNLSNKRIIVVGDSFTEGIGVTVPGDGYTAYMSAYLGVPDVWSSGSGGTGYTNSGTGQYNFAGRITDWTSHSPDIVLFAGGINDVDGGGYQAAVLDIISDTATALPDAIILVLGAFSGSTGPNSTVLTKEGKIKSDTESLGNPLVKFIPVSTDVPDPWVNGTGYVGATTGTGNSDIVTGSDGTHPSDYGHKYLGKRAADAIVKALRQMEIDIS
jgi:lysophospholipase L1-like esterase